MESRSLLKSSREASVKPFFFFFLQGCCFHHTLMAVKCLDLQWQLRPETSVTSDLWGMDKPGNKNRSLLCGSKGKHLLCWRHREKEGRGINSQVFIIWSFQSPQMRGAWWERAESHCTFHHYKRNPPPFLPIISHLPHGSARKKWLKNIDKYNIYEGEISLIWMLQSFLSHNRRSCWPQLFFHFLFFFLN